MVDIVQHYTTQDAFLKILTDGKLRCSHIRFMNDSKEFIHLVECIERAIEEKLGSGNSEFSDKKLYDSIHSQFRHAKNRSTQYICCFSSIADDLSQWRAYGKSIPGYSIGFHWERLKKVANEVIGGRLRAEKVIYDDNFGTSFVNKRYENYVRNLIPRENDWREQSVIAAGARDIMSDALFENAVEMGATYKHSGFWKEEEYRLIFPGHGKAIIEFDSGLSFVKPYITIDFKERLKEIVSEVWVGPGPNMELAVHGAKMFLKQLGLESVQVKPSILPYRNW